MPKGHHSPKALSVTLETVTVSGAGYALGIQEHRISGVVTRIYSPAKTVVDCFKFRNRVGIAVAMLALKDSVAMRKATLGEIFEIAKQCRMANVMRPYLEGVQQ